MLDINSDMGELPEAVEDGSQEALMPHLTSVNIACGGHAGDASMMRRTVDQARRFGLRIGAHPGYPDRANFGRLEMNLALEAVEQAVFEQCRALAAVCDEIVHVKAHGALYNQAAKDRPLAAAIARGAARFSREVALIGLAGSVMLEEFAAAGFEVLPEAFADRRYEPDGSLRSRRLPGALILDPHEAAAQALDIARRGVAKTICIHGDTPGAAEIACAVRAALQR
jgi:UPF0271 protein